MGIPRGSMKQGCSLGKGKALKITYICFESLFYISRLKPMFNI